jgi:hypothetical protein
MTEVIGTGAQIVNAAYAAKYAVGNTPVTGPVSVPSVRDLMDDMREFQMAACTVM